MRERRIGSDDASEPSVFQTVSKGAFFGRIFHTRFSDEPGYSHGPNGTIVGPVEIKVAIVPPESLLEGFYQFTCPFAISAHPPTV